MQQHQARSSSCLACDILASGSPVLIDRGSEASVRLVRHASSLSSRWRRHGNVEAHLPAQLGKRQALSRLDGAP